MLTKALHKPRIKLKFIFYNNIKGGDK